MTTTQLMQIPHNHGDLEDVLSVMPKTTDFLAAADTFRQLGDGTRLQILWLLCHSEQCVLNIAAAVEMSAPAVSHHLKGLRQSGLIVSRRSGKEVYYTLSDTKEAQLLHATIDALFEITCPKGVHTHEHTK